MKVKKVQNSCKSCGRFRRIEEILYVDGDYNEVSGEYETWTECVFCMSDYDYSNGRFKEKFGDRDKYLKSRSKG